MADENYTVGITGRLTELLDELKSQMIIQTTLKRFGKWADYLDNGKIKNSGYYYEDQPIIGLWQQHFNKRNLHRTYTISLVSTNSVNSFCKTGLYQEFYDNGQIEKYGFYKSSINTLIT